jgi:hypothetical protein
MLWKTALPEYRADEDLRTVSVEVLSISGNTATAVSSDPHILYDAEMTAIIRRAKSKSSGLVLTKIWNWRGSKYEKGEEAERKVQELGKRFGTGIVRWHLLHYRLILIMPIRLFPLCYRNCASNMMSRRSYSTP